MTTYSAVTSGQIDAESYIDVTLATQWTNNVLAMFEGDATASGVRLQTDAIASAAVTAPKLGTDVGAWVELQSSAATGSTIDFDNLLSSTYDVFYLLMLDIVPGTDGVNMHIKVAHDATPTYESTAYSWLLLENGAVASSSTSDVNIRVAESLGTGTGESLSGEIKIYNPGGSSYTKMTSSFTQYEATPTHFSVQGSFFRSSASSLTSIQLGLSSGTFSSGTFKLFGLNT